MLIGSAKKLSKSTLFLVASVASVWLHNMDIFYFRTKSFMVELDILVDSGFHMDLYYNRKTKTGHRNLGMSKWRRWFTLLSLLVALLLIESRILLPPLLQWHHLTDLGVSYCRAASQRVGPRLCCGPGSVHPRCKPVLIFVELDEVPVNPFLQPVDTHQSPPV